MKQKLINYFKYAAKKYIQAGEYIFDVVKAALITAVIMPPVALLTQWVIATIFSVDFGLLVKEDPIGDIVGDSTLLLFGVMMLVGILEETYFRYLIMDNLMHKFLEIPYKVAVPITSVMFGLVHLANYGIPLSIPQAVGAIAAGFWFSRIYLKRGLHFVIIVHALYNFLVTIVVKFFV